MANVGAILSSVKTAGGVLARRYGASYGILGAAGAARNRLLTGMAVHAGVGAVVGGATAGMNNNSIAMGALAGAAGGAAFRMGGGFRGFRGAWRAGARNYASMAPQIARAAAARTASRAAASRAAGVDGSNLNIPAFIRRGLNIGV